MQNKGKKQILKFLYAVSSRWSHFPIFPCKEYMSNAIAHLNITWNSTSQRYNIKWHTCTNWGVCTNWHVGLVKWNGKLQDQNVYMFSCDGNCMDDSNWMKFTSSFLNFMQRLSIAKDINLFYYQISHIVNEIRKKIMQVTLPTAKRDILVRRKDFIKFLNFPQDINLFPLG